MSKDSKLNKYIDIKCEVCGEVIQGKWDSQVYLGMETGELDKSGIHRWLIYDKHIKCSPSRAQRIVHPKYPVRLWMKDHNSIGGPKQTILGQMRCVKSGRQFILTLG